MSSFSTQMAERARESTSEDEVFLLLEEARQRFREAEREEEEEGTVNIHLDRHEAMTAYRAVLSQAPASALTPDLLALLELHDSRELESLATHPSLPTSLARQLMEGSLRRLRLRVRTLAPEMRSDLAILGELGHRKFLHRGSESTGYLFDLLERQLPATDSRDPAGDGGWRRRQLTLNVLDALLVLEDLTADEVLRLAEAVLPAITDDMAEKLLLDPRADLRLYRRLLEEVRPGISSCVPSVVAQIYPARVDAEIRPLLLQHQRDPQVLAYLCLEAGTETPPLFRELAKRWPSRAGRILPEMHLEGLLHLTDADLLPFLSHSQGEVRLGAVMAAARRSQEVTDQEHRADLERRQAWRGRYQERDLPF